MKEKPWLRALIIIIVPLAVALIDKFFIKSGYRGGTLFDLGLVVMLVWNMIFYIRTNLLKRFLAIIVGVSSYILITRLGPKSDKSIWQELLGNLVIFLIIVHMMNFPDKTTKEKFKG